MEMDPYAALTQLITSAEAITWNRFNNFLVSNTILILAWATVYASTNNSIAMIKMVLVVISVMGFVTCPMWAALGSRGREFLKKYVRLGSLIEDDNNWPKEFNQYKPFKETEKLREELPWKQIGSYFILTFIPWLYAVLYLALFAASIIKC